MKKNKKLFNYILSMFFILLILFVLLLMIYISRVVLDDNGTFKEHVTDTKKLLDNIEKVEKTVDNIEYVPNNQFLNYNEIEDLNFIFNANFKKINKVYYLNSKENKGIISFTLNSNVSRIDDFYYLNIENLTNIENSDVLIYNIDFKEYDLDLNLYSDKRNFLNNVSYGVVFEKHNFENNFELEVFDFQLKEVIFLNKKDILGEFLLKNSN